MPKKTLSISTDRLGDLGRAFSRTADGKLTDAELENLASIAIESWINALVGPARFRNLTELYVAWLKEVYWRHLPDEEPHERRLFTRLNFPYGQALYLARVLREEQPTSSRLRALANLRTALTAKATDAKQWVKDGRGEDRMSITISKGARRELDALLGSMIEEGGQARPIKVEGSMGDFVSILVVASDVNKVIEAARQAETDLKGAQG